MALWGVLAIFVSFFTIHDLAQQTFGPSALSIAVCRSATSLLPINLPDKRIITSFVNGRQSATDKSYFSPAVQRFYRLHLLMRK
jgi:hypothetical protein